MKSFPPPIPAKAAALANLITESDEINLDSLVDCLVAVYTDCSLIRRDRKDSQNPINKFLEKYKEEVEKLRFHYLKKSDFEELKVLAKGQYGVVSVVRCTMDNQIYALKQCNKLFTLRQEEGGFYMEERRVLSLTVDSDWTPKLYAAFQDEEYLYLLMEYAAGGDLLSLLTAQGDMPVLDEETARFYIAETILAVAHIHQIGYVHRDIKPANILIDNDGHVKLADFGSCFKLDDKGRVASTIPVGTCDYISPEVLQAREGDTTYGVECDWWSVGIVLYEMLFGDPPFYTDSRLYTYGRVMAHEQYLNFDVADIEISEVAEDLIKNLICDRNKRLGHNGVIELMKHPFFEGIDWSQLRKSTPPFVPEIQSPDDTRYFAINEDDFDSDPIVIPMKGPFKEFQGYQLPFVGYTFIPKLSHAETSLLRLDAESSSSDASERTQLIKSVVTLESILEQVSAAEEAKAQTSKSLYSVTAVKADESSLREKHEIEISEIKDSLDQARVLNESLEHKLEALEGELEDKTKALDTRLMEFTEVKSQKANLERQLNELTTEVDVIRVEKLKLENSRQELQLRCEDLENQKANIGSKLNSELESLRLKCDELSNQLQEKISAEVVLNEKITSLEAEAATIAEKNNVHIAEKEKLLSQLASLESSSISQEVDHLHGRLKDEVYAKEQALWQLEQALRDKKSLEIQFIKMKTKFETEVEAKKSLDLCVAALDESLASANASVANLTQRLSSTENVLKEKIEELSMQQNSRMDMSEYSMISGGSSKRSKSGDILDRLVQSLRNSLNEALAREETFMAKESELETKIKELNIKLEEKEDAIKHERDMHKQRMYDADLREEDLQRQYDEIRKTVEILTRDIRNLRERAPTAPSQAGTMRIDSTRRNLRVLPAEMIGTATTKKTMTKLEKERFKDLQHQLEAANRKIEQLEKENSDALEEVTKLKEKHDEVPEPSNLNRSEITQSEISNSDHKPPPHSRKSSDLQKLFTVFPIQRLFKVGLSPVEFSLKDQLKGWLKVSYGEKASKHSWKRRFIAVKEAKVLLFDKEKEYEHEESGTVVANIAAKYFLARGCSKADLQFASMKELDMCFQIRSLSAAEVKELRSKEKSDMTSVPLETFQNKYSELMEQMKKEEEVRSAAEQWMALIRNKKSKDYQEANSQMRASTRKIKNYQETLQEIEKTIGRSSVVQTEQTFERRTERRKSTHRDLKDILAPMGVNYGETTSLQPLPEEINEVRLVKGHEFIEKMLPTSTMCHHCQRALWTKDENIYFCQECGLFSHASCLNSIQESCQDYLLMKYAKPVYLMAHDPQEKIKWIVGLEYARNESSKQQQEQQQQVRK